MQFASLPTSKAATTASPRVTFRGERPGLHPEVGPLRRSTAVVGRFVAVAAATVTIGSSLALATATQASAGGADYQFLADVNSARSQHGLRPLTMAGDLHSLATSWSHHMAGQGGISHNPNLMRDGGNWQEIGENVGVGPNESALENAFMNSPEHRANILNPNYTEIGVGTATGSDGRLYVTQDFRKPMGSSSSGGTTHHSTTHHSTTTTSHHHTSSVPHTTTTTRHTASVTHRAIPRPVAKPAAPRPVPTLAARLRSAAERSNATDPVQEAMTFTATMRALTG
ncbi:MAG: CAP domain-containing protein [Actinomycetes bacterium]